MTSALDHIPRAAIKSVWVFALNVPKAQIKAWRHEAFPADGNAPTTWPLRDALGLERLDNDFTEVIDPGTFDDYGLARYLTDANGFADDSVAPDAARLDALTGPVALIFSQALGDEPVTLRPRPPLTFVGRYDTRPDLAPHATLHSDSAQGSLNPETPAPTPGLPLGWLAALLIVPPVLAALIFLVLT